MARHPPLQDLIELTPAAKAHLEQCAQCRIERRLYQRIGFSPADNDEPTSIVMPARTFRSSADSTAIHTGSTDEVRAHTEQNQNGLHGLRYRLRGKLGRGGMGEVLRVYDPTLNRDIALKIAHAHIHNNSRGLNRFLEEAQIQAQLSHPNLVPVHELGFLDDGRPYFTMDIIHGRSVETVTNELHDASSAGWYQTADGLTLRRLVALFGQVCRAVGYAHERSVIHRDLKPANLMLGDRGVVRVVDWGLAKVLGQPDRSEVMAGEESVKVRMERAATRMGSITGTPNYMPPEQARGDIDAIDCQSDVYSLGAVLYTILCGRVPYDEGDVYSSRAVLRRVEQGPPRPVRDCTSLPLPDELVAIVERAMDRDKARRYRDGSDIALAVEAWLDGHARREKAREVVAQAVAKRPSTSALRRDAAAIRSAGQALLDGIPGWQPEEAKLPGWTRLDEAAELDRQAEQAELEEVQLLHGALSHAPELPDAHAELAWRYRDAHAAAETARRNTTRIEYLLRAHVSALPAAHPNREAYIRYLEGDGALTLVSDPPGAEVVLYRYETHRRRLVPRRIRSLGKTPLAAVPLDKGSYLCILTHPDCHDVRYPVFIERGHHWDGVPPGETTPAPVRLPRSGEIATDECHVPAGWFYSGGDDEATSALPRRRLWCPSVVMKRHPVTNRQYLQFLNALVSQGRAEEALRFVPRERAGQAGQPGALIYSRNEQGGFVLVPDMGGDLWKPDWPVCQVDWLGARAYALWLRGRTGQSWRLPVELEWSKSARGVDGRYFPWGDQLDPSWCCYQDSHRGKPMPAEVGSHPIDESPYGVQDMAGNMREWCGDLGSRQGPEIQRHRVLTPASTSLAPTYAELAPTDARPGAFPVTRGGAWLFTARYARVASRIGYPAYFRDYYLGFRLVRDPKSTTR